MYLISLQITTLAYNPSVFSSSRQGAFDKAVNEKSKKRCLWHYRVETWLMCNAVGFLSDALAFYLGFFSQIRLRFVLIEKSDFKMGAPRVLLLPRYVLKQ